MDLAPEYIEFLRNEVKAFDDELREIKELPSVDSLRSRIKKDKRDTKDLLAFYFRMIACDVNIRAVKAEIRACNEVAMKLLGHNLQRPRRKYDSSRDTSYDLTVGEKNP